MGEEVALNCLIDINNKEYILKYMKGLFMVVRAHQGRIEVKQLAVINTKATVPYLQYNLLREHRAGCLDLPERPQKLGENLVAINGVVDEETATHIKQGDYKQDEDGNWYHSKSGQEVGHDEECTETYAALAQLFEIFSEIKID